MKTPTYKKTVEGKLEIKETKEEVREVSLEELKNRRAFYTRERDTYDAAIIEVDALIAEAGKLGVVEKVEEVEEVPAEISQEKIDEPVERAIVAE